MVTVPAPKVVKPSYSLVAARLTVALVMELVVLLA